jgi:hypothetical protein
MSTLTQITTKAKSLYKTGKYKKWTDAIKAASKTLKSTKNPVKKVVKKSAKKLVTKKISGWRKGSTVIREVKEKKIDKFKNVRVVRNPKGGLLKPGTFNNFHKISGLFDTSVIKDIDTLKKQYFQLAKKYHPDAGGTTFQFQNLQAEYEKLFKSLVNGSNLSSDEKDNEIVIDKAIRDIIDQIITLPNLNIEVVGKWLWVSGDTFPVYKILKSVGLQFIKKAGIPYWVYKGVESSGRGKMSMEEIKSKYGVQKFNPKDGGKRLSGTVSVFSKIKLKNALIKLTKGLNKRRV